MKQWAWMGFAAACVAAGTGCSNGTTADSGTPDGGNPSDGTGSDVAVDLGLTCNDAGISPADDAGTCLRATSCNGQPWCPATYVNDPMHPTFIVQEIDIRQPAPLMPRMPVGHILNNAISGGQFFWGISVDATATMMMRTGALQNTVTAQSGTGFYNDTFAYVMGAAPGAMPNRWDPVSSSITITGDTFTTQTIPLLTIPVYDTSTPPMLLAELPFRNARMHDVRMVSSRNCIGLAPSFFSSCIGGHWITVDPGTGGMSYGVIEADLTVADAMNVQVVSLSTNLCQLVAGVACTMPQSSWPTQPDTMVNGSTTPNAWHIIADFGAVAAHIQ